MTREVRQDGAGGSRATVRRVFMDALDADAARRTEVIQAGCQGDPSLRAEVEALLAALESGAEFLAGDPVGGESPGAMVGPYRLERVLGEGGFGTVYLANQQHPIRRNVALKVIKLGMDTRAVIARFESERQALAKMEHPAIAKVLDAGATSSGRPYFVMELVQGQPITAYCAGMELARRVRLMIRVCLGVQHAHQKGVVHRDLKPSNILVANTDGEDAPKIIDFGIAKATAEGGPAGASLAHTAARELIGTPEYMSPEAALPGGDVDTRADIFSLGVVLYELLTGSTPVDRERFRTAGLDEIRRIITDEEPIRPSTKIRRVASGVASAAPSGSPSPPPTPPGKPVADLDWIVMRCLEKDRDRRYQSAGALAADLQRFLDDQPIEARPPSAAYRLRKAIRRNRVQVGVGAALALAACIGVSSLAFGFVSVRRQRDVAEDAQKRAERSQTRADRVASFLKSIILGASPHVAAGKDTELLRSILADAAGRIDAELADAPEIQAELWQNIGQAYQNVAEHAEAIAAFQRARDGYAKLFGEGDSGTLQAGISMAASMRFTGKSADGLAVMDRGLVALRAEAQPDPLILGKYLRLRAELLVDAGRGNDAFDDASKAVEVLTPVANDDLAEAQSVLASLLRRRGRIEESERLYKAVIERFRTPDPSTGSMRAVQLGSALNNLATLYRQMQRFEEAESLLRESLATREKLYDRAHPDVAITMLNLGTVLSALERFDEGIPLIERSVAMHHELYKGQHVGEGIAMDRLGDALTRADRLDDAEPWVLKAEAIIRKLRPPGHPDLGTRAVTLGTLRMRQGRWEQAEAAYREAVEVFEKAGPAGKALVIVPRCLLAEALLRQEKYQQALPIAEIAEAGASEISGTESREALIARGVKSEILLGLGRLDEAEPLIRARLARIDKPGVGLPPELIVARIAAAKLDRLHARHAQADAALEPLFAALAGKDKGSALASRRLVVAEGLQNARTWAAAEPGQGPAERARTWAERATAPSEKQPTP